MVRRVPKPDWHADPSNVMNTENKSSKALPVLIYLLPAAADLVVALFLFVNAVRLARLGESATVVANSLTTWSVVYLTTCLLLGRVVSSANAARLMTAGLAALALISLAFTVVPGVAGIYVLMALAGVAAAFFFVPFQVFMKAVDSGHEKPVTYSTGLYTFSWSMGFAAGPLAAGGLMELGAATSGGPEMGWKYACAFSALVAGLSCLGVMQLRHLARKRPATAASPGQPALPQGCDYSRMPDLAWLGWVAGAILVLTITFIRGVFPVRAEAGLHLSQGLQGTLFFLLSVAQAFTGLALCRSRFWMYRTGPALAFGLAGMLGLLAFGIATNPWLLMAGALLFGIYSGGMFFYLVFHALVHPEKSGRYVATNEAVVGLAGMIGAAAGGWLADRYGFGVLFGLGAGVILLTVAFQRTVYARLKP